MTEIPLPVIVVNFKAYREVEGPRATHIATICEEVMEESGISIALCPPLVELSAVCSAVINPVFSQHVDPLGPGPYTGWITPSMVKAAGAKGTLINHSEHKIPEDKVGETVDLCRTSSLESIVCAETPEMARRLARFSPDFIAVEPPELIGGDVSVTTAKPEIVEDSVNAVGEVDKKIVVLCGAGVKNGKDVRAALDLGTQGVLVASGVVKAIQIKNALYDLISMI